jgi:hypothetical protein
MKTSYPMPVVGCNLMEWSFAKTYRGSPRVMADVTRSEQWPQAYADVHIANGEGS